VDANQAEIVKALRKIPGVRVRSLAAVGDGVPDLLVGYRGRNWLLECKDPSKPPSKRKLTEDQDEFFAVWTGQVAKIETIDDARGVLGI
jgi:hypothetical protein